MTYKTWLLNKEKAFKWNLWGADEVLSDCMLLTCTWTCEDPDESDS